MRKYYKPLCAYLSATTSRTPIQGCYQSSTCRLCSTIQGKWRLIVTGSFVYGGTRCYFMDAPCSSYGQHTIFVNLVTESSCVNGSCVLECRHRSRAASGRARSRAFFKSEASLAPQVLRIPELYIGEGQRCGRCSREPKHG